MAGLRGADTHAQTSGQVHAVGSPVTVADSRDGVGATPASSSVQASQGDRNKNGQIKARASAQVGRLKVIYSALGGTVGPSSNDSAGARASSSDLLRIDAGINLAGQTGTVAAQIYHYGFSSGKFDATGYQANAEWSWFVNLAATGAATVSGCGGWNNCLFYDAARNTTRDVPRDSLISSDAARQRRAPRRRSTDRYGSYAFPPGSGSGS